MSRRVLVLSWFALKAGLRRSPKTVSAKAMLLALVVASCMALSAGQALADQVNCGDTLTRDTKLHRDLNCAGSGLIIGPITSGLISMGIRLRVLTGKRASVLRSPPVAASRSKTA
jgi:hypothetical protein